MTQNLSSLIFSAFLSASILFTACGGSTANSPSNSAAPSGPTIAVADAVHGDQNVPIDPQRVVSFDYGALDTFAALGSSDKVIGLPKSNLPELLNAYGDSKYADVGTLFEPNFELLYTLKPDLIIVSGRAAAKIPELRQIAPTIFVEPKNDNYYDTFKDNTRLFGRILKKEDLVDEKLQELDKRTADLKAKATASEKTGLISLYTGGKISVYGPRSRFGIVHQAFGIKPADTNIKEAAQHGQLVNFEYIKQIDPDYLFVIDRAKILGEETLAKSFLDNDVIKSTKAAKDGHIIYLDTEIWYTVSGGLQSMGKMIAELDAIVK